MYVAGSKVTESVSFKPIEAEASDAVYGPGWNFSRMGFSFALV